jgi:hypothetical protein
VAELGEGLDNAVYAVNGELTVRSTSAAPTALGTTGC